MCQLKPIVAGIGHYCFGHIETKACAVFHFRIRNWKVFCSFSSIIKYFYTVQSRSFYVVLILNTVLIELIIHIHVMSHLILQKLD